MIQYSIWAFWRTHRDFWKLGRWDGLSFDGWNNWRFLPWWKRGKNHVETDGKAPNNNENPKELQDSWLCWSNIIKTMNSSRSEVFVNCFHTSEMYINGQYHRQTLNIEMVLFLRNPAISVKKAFIWNCWSGCPDNYQLRLPFKTSINKQH